MKSSERQPIAERSVLALMLKSSDARKRALSDGLTADHFVEHQAVFQAIEDLHRIDCPVDAATVAGRITPEGNPDIDVHEEVERIYHLEPDSQNWTSWLQSIRRAYASRIASDASQYTLGESDPSTQQLALETAVEAIKEALSGPTGAKTAKRACGEFLQKMLELKKLGKLPGISTGIEELDAVSGGMRPGELWACLGPTSGGKTVLMSQIATHSMLDGKRIAFFSCEMMVDEIIARLVANVGNVSLTKVLQPADWKQLDHSGRRHGDRVTESLKILAESNAWFDDTPRMSMRHIENECQRLADQNDGLDLIVVDYMQIVASDSARRESREQEVARVSGSLKQLAKKIGCPVLSASQLNDDGKVRESRAIAFDANVLLGIEENGIRIVKMRNGKKDDGEEPSLKLTMNGALQRFE